MDEPGNGYQARVPFRWLWKEDWEISIFLMSQSDKPVKTPPNRISKILLIDFAKIQFRYADYSREKLISSVLNL